MVGGVTWMVAMCLMIRNQIQPSYLPRAFPDAIPFMACCGYFLTPSPDLSLFRRRA